MFDNLAIAYKDSDYIIVIAVIHWPKRIFLVLKLILVLELWVLLFSHWLPLLECSLQLLLAECWQYSSQERTAKILTTYTAMLTTVHWHLHAETHPGGEVVSTVTRSCLPFSRHCSPTSNSHGHHMACAL